MLKYHTAYIAALLAGFMAFSAHTNAKTVEPQGPGAHSLTDSFIPKKAGQDNSLGDMLQPGFFPEKPNGNFSLKSTCADCYPKNITGMTDNSTQSKARSTKEGSAVQYVLGTEAIDVAGVDTQGLAVDLNDFVRVTGAYFKTKPELKGYFRAVFTYFPGKPGKPYQFDNTSAEISGLNKSIAEGTSCNDKKVCAVFAVMGLSYTNPDNKEQRFSAEDFGKFISKNSKTQDHKFYHTNASYNEPITVIVYQGLNGFFIDKELVEADLMRIKSGK